MTEIAVLQADNVVALPSDVAGRFRPADRFLVWVEGDTIHLKRMAESVLDIVASAPEGEPVADEEINDIVHEVRHRNAG
jgi:hypothetical protein